MLRFTLSVLALSLASFAGVKRVDARETADAATPLKACNALTRSPYIIEPPDVLGVKGVNLVPERSHLLEPSDVVTIHVEGAPSGQAIDENHTVDADGKINLGLALGRVRVAGMTIDECQRQVGARLAKTMRGDLKTNVTLFAANAFNQITGQHLVAMDGRLNLGAYGSVFVAGMTIDEARAAIERKLAERLSKPEVAIDVLACNSKVYYIITQGGGGLGDDVTRMPITGNETVIDVVATLGGISQASSTQMWIARPAANGSREQILPISWNEIAEGASTATNYQLLPGDRLFMKRQSSDQATSAGAEDAATLASYYAFVRPMLSAATNSEAPPSSDPPATPAEGCVAFQIAILEDSHDVLAEFGSLRDGFLLDETGTALDALRVLEKNRLVTRRSSPKLIAPLGVTAEMKMDSPAANNDRVFRNELAVGVCAREDGDRLSVEIEMNRHDGDANVSIDTRVEVKSGQTVLLNASGPSAKANGEAVKRRTYLVLTPTLVK